MPVLFQVTFAEDDEIAQRHVSSQTRWNTQDIAVQVQSFMLEHAGHCCTGTVSNAVTREALVVHRQMQACLNTQDIVYCTGIRIQRPLCILNIFDRKLLTF